MDIVALSYEDRYAESHPNIGIQSSSSDYSSLYALCVHELRNVTDPSLDQKWAMRYFNYDYLALVNVEALMDVGGWDTQIPYYNTDCDLHERLDMNGWTRLPRESGHIFDVASSLDDLIVLYRKAGTAEPSFTDPNIVEEELRKEAEGLESVSSDPDEFLPRSSSSNVPARALSDWTDDTIGSTLFHILRTTSEAMQTSKYSSDRGRNTWQARQTGGKGEPFYRDSAGFETAIHMAIDHGRAVYGEKWGYRECDLINSGLGPDDAWKVEHDWE